LRGGGGFREFLAEKFAPYNKLVGDHVFEFGGKKYLKFVGGHVNMQRKKECSRSLGQVKDGLEKAELAGVQRFREYEKGMQQIVGAPAGRLHSIGRRHRTHGRRHDAAPASHTIGIVSYPGAGIAHQHCSQNIAELAAE
jgi:hypothetical protein